MSFWFKNLLNSIFFPLRNNIAFSRPISHIPNEEKTNIFSEKNTVREEQLLIKNFHLSEFRNTSKITHYKENLYYLKLLIDTFNNIEYDWKKGTLNILDIGSKNFSYATALQHFFSYFNNKTDHARNIYLDGIEIDPYRIMINLHSRYDYANYYIKNLKNTRYLTCDFMKLEDKEYDLITWFLPFVLEDALIHWGLPEKFLKPEMMLNHAYKNLKHGGIILIINQSESEKAKQIEIINKQGLKYQEIKEPYENCFSPFQYKRLITIITKD